MLMTPEKAREWLIASGSYTEETVPSLTSLGFLIGQVETRFDEWLGYSVSSLQPQRQQSKTNRQGHVFLNYYPVTSVESVKAFFEVDPNYKLLPAKWEEISSAWNGKITIATEFPGLLVEIEYTAGFDPVPPIFENAFFQLLRQCLENSGTSGNLSFLDEPIRDVSSISVPGISKSFRLSDASKAGAGESSQLDRILAPLVSRRRKYIF